jgi:hypothetical protein
MTATPPPLPAPSDWDVPSTRIVVLVLAAANTVFWLYTFRFLLARSNPMGDGFDMLPTVPFTLIFFCLTLSAAIKGIRGRDLGLALGLVLGATVLNGIVFLSVVGLDISAPAGP